MYIYILGVARYTDVTVRYVPLFGGHGSIRFRYNRKKKEIYYAIKIKYSEPNISAPASVSPLAFAVLLLLAVIKQRCIAAGAPFWIGGELPVFVVRPHALNREACTVTVRYKYMYRATVYIYIYIYIYPFLYQIYLYLLSFHIW